MVLILVSWVDVLVLAFGGLCLGLEGCCLVNNTAYLASFTRGDAVVNASSFVITDFTVAKRKRDSVVRHWFTVCDDNTEVQPFTL